MTTYSSKIVREQGGSELLVASGGSITIAAGGVLNISGNQNYVSGATVTIPSGASETVALGAVLNVSGKVAFASGASETRASGAYSAFGNTQILFGNITSAPTVSASPGSIYFRSDGSVSNLYVNISTGTAGSVWKGASIFS